MAGCSSWTEIWDLLWLADYLGTNGPTKLALRHIKHYYNLLDKVLKPCTLMHFGISLWAIPICGAETLRILADDFWLVPFFSRLDMVMGLNSWTTWELGRLRRRAYSRTSHIPRVLVQANHRISWCLLGDYAFLFTVEYPQLTWVETANGRWFLWLWSSPHHDTRLAQRHPTKTKMSSRFPECFQFNVV